MPDTPEYTMPEGMSALTKSEISQLRTKIGKSHRTEKEDNPWWESGMVGCFFVSPDRAAVVKMI